MLHMKHFQQIVLTTQFKRMIHTSIKNSLLILSFQNGLNTSMASRHCGSIIITLMYFFITIMYLTMNGNEIRLDQALSVLSNLHFFHFGITPLCQVVMVSPGANRTPLVKPLNTSELKKI